VKCHRRGVEDAVFSPDGGLVATAGTDGAVVLWNIADPDVPVRCAVLKDEDSAVWAVAFSPLGRLLVTAGVRRDLKLYDITDSAAPEIVGVIEWEELGNTVAAARFSPDAQLLATAGGDGVKLWELDAKFSVQSQPKLLSSRGAFAIDFSPDGTLLAVGESGRAILIGIPGAGISSNAIKIARHNGEIWSTAFSADGDLLVCGTSRGMTKIFMDVVGTS
jgi:WD40 repeat protein